MGSDLSMSSTGTITVIELGSEDVSQLRVLLGILGAAFDDAITYSASPPGDDYLRRVVGGSSVIVLAAFAEETMVGGLVAYELHKLEQERSEIYIYDLAVAEEYRRRGVATALIERVKSIARQRRAWVVYVQADYVDEPAVALYTKLGVREDVLHFDIAPD